MSAVDLAVGELPAGPLVVVRQAAERDRTAVAEMFGRCSEQTRYRRFHGHVNVFPRGYLTEALGGGPEHFALVACAGGGSVVALASCRTVAPGAAELGFLVEDAWQRLGIGRVLLRSIVEHADRAGLRVLMAQVLSEQAWIVRVLGAYGPCSSVTSHGVLDVTLQNAA